MDTKNIGIATAIGAGVGTAFYSATGEAVWIGIGAAIGALFSFLKDRFTPKKARVRIRVKK